LHHDDCRTSERWASGKGFDHSLAHMSLLFAGEVIDAAEDVGDVVDVSHAVDVGEADEDVRNDADVGSEADVGNDAAEESGEGADMDNCVDVDSRYDGMTSAELQEYRINRACERGEGKGAIAMEALIELVNSWDKTMEPPIVDDTHIKKVQFLSLIRRRQRASHQSAGLPNSSKSAT
jgi:hypothetical protein